MFPTKNSKAKKQKMKNNQRHSVPEKRLELLDKDFNIAILNMLKSKGKTKD